MVKQTDTHIILKCDYNKIIFTSNFMLYAILLYNITDDNVSASVPNTVFFNNNNNTQKLLCQCKYTALITN